MWLVLNRMPLPVWAKKGIFCVLPRGSRFTTPSSTVNVSFTLCPYTADLGDLPGLLQRCMLHLPAGK
ncbi:MAG: hypothetical protein J6W19_11560 [Prevotella sp.]|nr:hypothetical protein [Prevotella sp.]